MNRTRFVSPALLALLTVACAGMEHPPPMHETRRVAIAGEQADTLGETLDGPYEGHVLVHTNDGRDVWALETSLREPALAADGWVLLAHDGGIIPAQVVRPLDDFLEVRIGQIVGIAPMHAIVAILHTEPTVPVTPEAAFATTTALPEDEAE